MLDPQVGWNRDAQTCSQPTTCLFILRRDIMARSTTDPRIIKFYSSTRWKRAQRYIKTKYRGLCQECGKAGWEVHHIKPLTPFNLNDESIALSEDDLTLLCTSCHNAERSGNYYVRKGLMFDDEGNLISKQPPLGTIEK